MTPDSREQDYLLGSSDAEHERLIHQAARLAPVTEQFFRDAGIGAGQRVLDLGAGVGDVAMLAARLVGPSGQVVALERDERSIDRARKRASAAGLCNLEFVQGEITGFVDGILFDAAVGRYILQFLPDPVAVLRSVAGQVRPGGIVAFQEGTWATFLALSRHPPLWSAAATLLYEAAVRFGVHVEMESTLHRSFQEAGLPVPKMRLEMELGYEPEFTQWLFDSLMSGAYPHAGKLNLSLEMLGDVKTLKQR